MQSFQYSQQPTIPDGIRSIPSESIGRIERVDPITESLRESIQILVYRLMREIDGRPALGEKTPIAENKNGTASISVPGRWASTTEVFGRFYATNGPRRPQPKAIQRAVSKSLGSERSPVGTVSDHPFVPNTPTGTKPGQSPLFIVNLDIAEDTLTFSRVEHLDTLSNSRQYQVLRKIDRADLPKYKLRERKYITWHSDAGRNLRPVIVPPGEKHHLFAIPYVHQAPSLAELMLEFQEKLQRVSARAAGEEQPSEPAPKKSRGKRGEVIPFRKP